MPPKKKAAAKKRNVVPEAEMADWPPDAVPDAVLEHEHPPHTHPEVPEHPHPVAIEHTHEGVPAHKHDLEHDHDHDLFALAEHTHPPDIVDHGHEHTHEPHEHRDQRALSVGAVRAVIAVLEAGSLNTDQAKALHAVRVVIGDAHGTSCAHENHAYDVGDVLKCTDCGAVLEATP